MSTSDFLFIGIVYIFDSYIWIFDLPGGLQISPDVLQSKTTITMSVYNTFGGYLEYLVSTFGVTLERFITH